MKKLIILTAATSILLLAGGQQVWASDKGRNDNDDYRAFKKIVRVMDVLINDGHHRGKTHVIVKTCHPPKGVCYRRGPRRLGRYKGYCCELSKNERFRYPDYLDRHRR
ncbi:MAG: hypothetical protein JW847_07545 [Candidatus Omnitrophica bacterium]|nr:hypothetical protein [Candidatus Omnitrophota bacterium]